MNNRHRNVYKAIDKFFNNTYFKNFDDSIKSVMVMMDRMVFVKDHNKKHTRRHNKNASNKNKKNEI